MDITVITRRSINYEEDDMVRKRYTFDEKYPIGIIKQALHEYFYGKACSEKTDCNYQKDYWKTLELISRSNIKEIVILTAGGGKHE